MVAMKHRLVFFFMTLEFDENERLKFNPQKAAELKQLSVVRPCRCYEGIFLFATGAFTAATFPLAKLYVGRWQINQQLLKCTIGKASVTRC